MVRCTVKEAVAVLLSKLSDQLGQRYRILHQQEQWKILQERKSDKDLLINCDWSENWKTKYADEIQPVHFGGSHQQISLHTGIAQSSKFQETFSSFSEVTRHDPSAIFAHLRKVLTQYVNETTEKLPFMTDGPTPQYRNRSMFQFVAQYLPAFFLSIRSITWNFSARLGMVELSLMAWAAL